MATVTGSTRGSALAADLEAAADAFIIAIRDVDAATWSAVVVPGTWSVGKEAAHVAEAMVMHQWIVRRTIRDRVPSRRPPIERREMTTEMAPWEVAALLRSRAAETAALLRTLTDAQLDLETVPPRGRGQRLAETIERVLVAHVGTHRAAIAGKLDR